MIWAFAEIMPLMNIAVSIFPLYIMIVFRIICFSDMLGYKKKQVCRDAYLLLVLLFDLFVQ